MRFAAAGAVVAVVFAVGCARSASVVCDDGTLCPPGNTCTALGCASQQQIDQCQGMNDGANCNTDVTGPSQCYQGICIAANCGDGVRAPSEICDGTQFSTQSTCKDAGFYSDGMLTCSSLCDLDTSGCVGRCGDHEINGPEICDGDEPTQSCVDFGQGTGTLHCSSGCGPDLTDCIPFGWRSIALPDNALGISGTSDTNIWVVGANGMVQRFDGTTWKAVSVDACTNSQITTVAAISDSEAFVGDGAGVIHITASGCTRDDAPMGPAVLWAASATDVYAGRVDGLWHFNGTAWTMVDANPVDALWGRNGSDIYRGNQFTSTLWHYDGNGWTSSSVAGLSQILGLWGTADTVYIGGIDGSSTAKVIKNRLGVPSNAFSQQPGFGAGSSVRGGSANATQSFIIAATSVGAVLGGDGAGWTNLQAPYFDGNGATFLAPSGVLYLIRRNAAHVFVFDGSTRLPTGLSPTNAQFLAVSGTGTAFVTAATVLWIWNGVAWTTEANSSHSLDVTVDSTGYAITTGINGTVARFSANSYSAVVNVAGKRVIARSIDDFFVQKSMTTIVRWVTPGPVSATITLPNVLNDWIWVTQNFAIAVGDNGMIQHWNGSAWVAQTSPTTEHLTHVVAASNTDAYALGGHVLLHYDGASWTVVPNVPLTDLLRAVAGRTGDLFLATDGGLLHHDGTVWTPVQTAQLAPISEIEARGDSVFWLTQSRVEELFRSRAW